MTSPKVIVRTNYKLSLSNHDRSKFYNNIDKKYVDHIIDYYKEDKKRVINMIDYFTGKINKHQDINLVLENGKYATKDEAEKRKKYINKQFNNSNVWQIVLSIDKKLVDENMSWDELEQELAKKILPQFFKNMGFVDVKNMCYEFSLHTNTKHPHFHISFMEKKPNTYSYDNKLMYRRKGKIPLNAINSLKTSTVSAIERAGRFRPKAIKINKDIEEIKKLFDPKIKNYVLYDRNNILLEEKILRLGQLLNERNISFNNRIKFNSIKDCEIKQLTKQIKNDLFELNKDLKISSKKFNESIKDMNDYFIELNKTNNINIDDVDLSYTKGKEKYLENFILNAIVNHARYNYKKGESKIVNSSDIIQSIILNNIEEDEQYSKKDIIINAISNKSNNYPLKQQIYNAIKNIDRELSEASQEYERILKQKPKEKVRWY